MTGLLKDYSGRETPLYLASNLTRKLKGPKIYLKREDLNHTGSHKINNTRGQVRDAYSIAAGLDYPGVGPEHAFFHQTGRARYVSVGDGEAIRAFRVLTREEGIIPALESAHARDAKTAGVDGVLVVDLPPEEAGELRRSSDPLGLDFISLLAPTTGKERLGAITARARGFLYYISIVGITGTFGPEYAALRRGVARVRKLTDLPGVVGFGLAEPEQVREVAPIADGVVVGSALVRMIHELGGRKDGLKRISDFIQRLKKALDSGHPVKK